MSDYAIIERVRRVGRREEGLDVEQLKELLCMRGNEEELLRIGLFDMFILIYCYCF